MIFVAILYFPPSCFSGIFGRFLITLCRLTLLDVLYVVVISAKPLHIARKLAETKAIGTTDFDALIQAMDNLSLNLSEKVVMQIGRSKYMPEHCEYFRFVPSLAPYYNRASLVVSHSGLGIVTEVLERRLPLVAVEDPNQPDRHQREILSVWEREGYLIWCKDLQKLPEAIDRAKTQLRPYVTPKCQIHTIVAEFLDDLEYNHSRLSHR